MKQELVSKWMTPNPITIEADVGLTKAHELFQEYDIRRLPVVNKKGDLLGIVTLGDIREVSPSDATSLNVWELTYLWTKLNISEVMTPDPVTVYSCDTIAEAASIMLENKFSGIPVVEPNGALVGIITESDIFRLVVHQWGAEEPEGVFEMAISS